MSALSSSPLKESWMTIDPAHVPTPSFGWYQPRYLRPSTKDSTSLAGNEAFSSSFKTKSENHSQVEEEVEGRDEREGKGDHRSSSFSSLSTSPSPSSFPLRNRAFFPPISHSLLLASSREKNSHGCHHNPSAPATSRSTNINDNRTISSSLKEEVERLALVMEDEVRRARECYQELVANAATFPPESQSNHATGKLFFSGDWESVTPLEELWRGPVLSAKVPPASDYARLLER